MKILSFLILFISATVLGQQENLKAEDPCPLSVTLSGPSQTEDTQILSSRPNNNYNYTVSNTTYYSSDNGADARKNSLIYFTIPSFLTPTRVISAKLSLYFNPTDPYETFNFHYGSDNGFTVRRITQPWDSYTVTWNTQPSFTNTNEVSLPAPSVNNQNYPDINVTNLVKDMLSTSNHGFHISLTNNSFDQFLLFASSTHSNSSLHPKLKICYRPVIAPIIEDTSIKIKTNPVVNTLQVSFPSTYINSQVEIISSDSKVVLRKIINNKNEVFDTSNLKSGIYYLKMTDNESKSITVEKFMKK